MLCALGVLVAAFTVASLSGSLSASYTDSEYSTFVEIDGKPFGTFDQIRGLKDLAFSKNQNDYTVVSLDRDFVTDPSLYLWAKTTTRNRVGLKDVHLVMKNSQGEEVSRYVLKLSRPLSWSLEAADPTLGGFHEKVKLAVQEIAIY